MLSMLGEEEVTAGTDVFYICQQYSLVFVLDMTSTTMQVVSEPFNITVCHLLCFGDLRYTTCKTDAMSPWYLVPFLGLMLSLIS